MRVFYSIAIFFLLVFPFIVVSIPGVPTPMGRAVAVSCFVCLLPLAVIWYGISPKVKMIRASGKLSEPRFDKVRPYIETSIRALIVACGLFFSYAVTVPIGLDLFRFMAGEKPTRVIGVTTDKSVSLGGLWFLKQSVQLGSGRTTYYLFYSWEPLQVGQSYEFLLLPRSKVILEFHKIG